MPPARLLGRRHREPDREEDGAVRMLRPRFVAGALPAPAPFHEPEVDGRLYDADFAQSPRLIAMWRAGRMCDVEVRIAGRSFLAHQLVLAAGSDMLAAAFSPAWSRSQDNDNADTEPAPRPLELYDIPTEGFENVLEFLYMGACLVSEATLTSTLDAASRLQISPLVRLGENYVLSRLDASNCVDAWLLAEGLQLERLANAARALTLEQFEEASLSDGLLRLELHHLRWHFQFRAG